MKTQRIYLDTSVIGGCLDQEFDVYSNSLIRDIEIGVFSGVTSEMVFAEISDAPILVQKKFDEFLDMNPEILNIEQETIKLVENYLNRNILSEKYSNDMYHIAPATIAKVDILVSWNFRHIVRFDKIRQFNAVNIENGYHPIEIYSPREVTTYEKD